MNIINSLKEFGLNEAETKVYISLLTLIEATVYQIARETGIPRTSIYLILESLKKQGLVMPFKKNNILHYTAENPNKFFELIKRKEDLLKNIVPKLQNLIQTHEFKPIVKLYEGKNGLKIVLDDILYTAKRNKIKELCGIVNADIFNILPKYFPEWIKKRVALKINTKLIGPEAHRFHPTNTNKPGELREFKHIPNKYSYKYMIYFYGRKLALISLKEQEVNSLIIESPALVEMFQALFNFTWDQLGEVK